MGIGLFNQWIPAKHEEVYSVESNIRKIPGMLSDIDIRNCFGEEIKIYTDNKYGEFSFDLDKQLQLASIDLRFRNECKRFKEGLNSNLTYEMLRNHEYTAPFEIANSEKLVINPGEVIFTTTLETVCISTRYAGIITGRSSIARLGIMVHCCQEFVNPGQGAPIALQITNLGKYSVELDLRTPICQLILFRLSTPSSNSYNDMEKSKYKNEKTATSSKIYIETDIEANTENSNQILRDNEKKINLPINFLKKYIVPFCPSILMLLFISPMLNNSSNITISSFFISISQAPVIWIIGVIMLAIYIVCKRSDK